jgi:SAM-dependent methyltransferase
VAEYEPERYWSEVARHIGERPDDSVVAGEDTPYYHYKRARFLERFLGSLSIRGTRVLEVGCGPGGNLRELALRQPARLVGVDISQAMIDLASAMVEREHLAVELVKVDGASLPFPDRDFDLSLTVTVLHHNLDESTFQKLVGEICRVTAGSVVLVEDTNPVLKRGEAVIGRPIALYEEAVAAHGFALESAAFLDTRATFFGYRAIMKAWRMAGGSPHEEGAPIPKAINQTEKLVVAAAKPFDNLWHDRSGLTKMTFTRRQ